MIFQTRLIKDGLREKDRERKREREREGGGREKERASERRLDYLVTQFN